MTLVVPFDGSELAEAALVRAVEFSGVLDEDVLAVAVIPDGKRAYARERGWVGPDEEFDMETVVSNLHQQVVNLAPSADFRHETVSQFASTGTITKQIRQVLKEEDASMVFIGSENAGRMVTDISSVGGTVASGTEYDVVLVRNRGPTKVTKLRNHSPERKPKSDFYHPQ